MSRPQDMIQAAQDLSEAVQPLTFSDPVYRIYNPLEYAWPVHRAYLETYAVGPKKIVMMGMNPGPWGMAQTGVPFGEIDHVRDWLGLFGLVGKPEHEHPKRLIEGFGCARSEVSGRRLWGLMKERFGRADRFFEDHFVLNYCPLVFMRDTGANITPDKLSAAERTHLSECCDHHLRRVLEILDPEYCIGIGKYAEGCLERVAGGSGRIIGSMLHPSPASPAANRDFDGTAVRQMQELGVW